MVGNDHVDTELLCIGNLIDIGTGAIGCDNKLRAALLEHIERANIEAATVALTMRDMIRQRCVMLFERT